MAEAPTAASTAVENVSNAVSKFASTTTIVIVFSSAIFIALFITAFVRMTQFLGSKDDWNDLKPKITEIILYIIFGVIAFTIASLMYYIQNPPATAYFTLIVACMSLGFSYAALAVAAISR